MTEKERLEVERRRKRARFIEASDFPEEDPRKVKEKEDKKKKKKKTKKTARTTLWALVGILVTFFLVFALLDHFFSLREEEPLPVATEDEEPSVAETKAVYDMPEVTVDLIPVNDYSRGGELLEQVTGIVVHYTGNPGTTAKQNRSYFEYLATTHEARVSSHFVIGLEGEIIQCIPLAEVSYCSNERNNDTIAIECCHMDDTGAFTDETYDALVYLCAYLIGKYDLEPADIIRHYDITGKECPRYYVNNEEAWQQFREDVENYILLYGQDKAEVKE